MEKQYLNSPSGFPDMPPEDALLQNKVLEIIKRNYELYGFSPIETPIVERTQILTAKSEGEINSQIYGLRLLNPAEDSQDDTKDLALRFDHTVPLARFVATNFSALAFPFKRYAIGPVFRGERAQKGRERQFIQADIDIIGNEKLDIKNDAEVLAVINSIFTELGFKSFTIRVGNRKILTGLLNATGLSDSDSVSRSLGIIDRLDKIEADEVLRLLSEFISKEDARSLIDILTVAEENTALIEKLESLELGELFAEGVEELKNVINTSYALGVPEENIQVDISIARGLDYYTGTVYETRIDSDTKLGSVASGGRYADLASAFINKKLPGVGISIGVSRLLEYIKNDKSFLAKISKANKVLIAIPEDKTEEMSTYFEMAQQLRNANIPTEVYLEARPLPKQLQFADKNGFVAVVIAGKDELISNTVAIKNMKTGEQNTVPVSELVSSVESMLK